MPTASSPWTPPLVVVVRLYGSDRDPRFAPRTPREEPSRLVLVACRWDRRPYRDDAELVVPRPRGTLRLTAPALALAAAQRMFRLRLYQRPKQSRGTPKGGSMTGGWPRP